ncbi:MAG: hypothetical protein R2873_11100 [Caldilineaceae bacterium]|nr:hypothetical protein [Caldilineaceae bacterium]
MSHDPPNAQSPPHRESFIVRAWRATDASAGSDGDGWRCHLIHVGTGRHLPCDHPEQVGERLLAWLEQMAQDPPTGLR